MEIRNHSKLSLDLQINFSKQLFWKSSRKTIITVEIVLCAIIGVVLGLYREKWWIALLAGIVAIVLPIALHLMLNQTTKKTLVESEKQDMTDHTEMEYYFHEEKMEVKIMSLGFSSMLNYSYDQFQQIIETKDLFVFILDNNQALYVEKNGFYSDYQSLHDRLSSYPSYRKFK